MGASDPPPGLSPTLAVRVDGDTVRMVLQVTNAGPDAVSIEFGSAQRFDFAVRDAAGSEVWRWSADRGFAQMLGSEQVGPGETLKWEASWVPGGRVGMFEAIGVVTSSSHPIELATPFDVPAR